MKNFPKHMRSGIAVLFLITLALVAVTPVFSQTSPDNIVFTSINVNQTFPEVSVQAKVLDPENNFVPGLALDQFTLSEDGRVVAIESATSTILPLNLHVVFIIDELVIGENMPLVRDAIRSFATGQMLPNDSVEVIAAAEKNVTQVIVPFTNDPQEVISAVDNYDPGSASGTELQGAINQALDELEAVNANTVGLNKIVAFSVSMINQRGLSDTIARANELSVPVTTVLLGSSDASGALGKLARDTGAGNGVINAANVDQLKGVLAPERNEEQYLIVYRSEANVAGEHELTLTVNGQVTKSAGFTLDALDPPLVTITTPDEGTNITREETFLAGATDKIEPTEQTVAVTVNFSDGHPREIVLENTNLVVNGKALGPATSIRDNGKSTVLLEFSWDLRNEDTPGVTPIAITVEVEDELGLKGTSQPRNVSVEFIGGNCPDFVANILPGLCSNQTLIGLLGVLVVVVILLVVAVVYLRRNPKIQQQVKKGFATMMTRSGGSELKANATRIVAEADSAKAVLIVVEGNAGSNQIEFPINETTTIGRSGDHSKLVIQGNKDNSPISRMHCTIIEKDGTFELRDESSANGTHLNAVRLPSGKSQRLNNDDIIELAKVSDGGVKFRFQIREKKKPMATRIMSSSSVAEELATPEGYMPTIPPESDEPEEKVTPDGYTPTIPPQSKNDESNELTSPEGYTPTIPPEPRQRKETDEMIIPKEFLSSKENESDDENDNDKDDEYRPTILN